MFVRNLFTPFIVFRPEGDEGGGGTGTATPPAPTPEQQPPPARGRPAGRQGAQGQGQGQEDGLLARFPTIPEEHKALLAPHLKEVQGHVTQLEQKFAPLKEYTPEQVQGLSRFASDFEQNPLAMWMGLATQLQKDGVIHEDLDLEALAAYSQGQFDDDDEPPAPGQQAGAPEELPPWAAEMKSKLDQFEQKELTREQQQQQQAEDQFFQTQLGTLKTTLQEAGIPEDLITDELLTAQLIVHRGNIAEAEKALVDLRTGLLKGFVENKNGDEPDVPLPKGAPPAPKPPGGRRAPRDAFGKASIGAEQYLKKSIAGASQE